MKICMKSLDKLASRDIWRHFSDICGIPHPSKKEGRLVQHIKRFGESLGLETIVDEIGNVLIRKAATAGMEGCKSVVFQSHVDMVCEKNGDVEFDFDNDAIEPYVDGGWVKARGTTLGADNGIGVAAQMALLASKDIEHGPIECLFTVDEETGLSGANAFGSGLLRSKILINLDSEEDGNFCIGCAGGIDTVAKFPLEMKNAPKDLFYFRVDVKGFKGGHSGEDINKGRGNAVQTLARYLCRLKREFPLAVSEIHGGNLRNAIAREAFAVVGVPYKQKERVRVMLNVFIDEAKKLCNVCVIDYNHADEIYDNSFFYSTFVSEISSAMNISAAAKNELIVNTNLAMQILNETGVSPYRTFDSISRLVELLALSRAENYIPRITTYQVTDDTVITLIEPPCGSNTAIIQSGGEYLEDGIVHIEMINEEEIV